MSLITIDTLELTEENRRRAREEIQSMAYLAWQRAGCPEGDPLRFWHAAEDEWICFSYVPDRSLINPHVVSPVTRKPYAPDTSTQVAVESRA